MNGTPLRLAAPMGAHQAEILGSFHIAAQNLDAFTRTMLENDKALRFNVNHTLGVCLGSIFSQRIIHLAYHPGRYNNLAEPLFSVIVQNRWQNLGGFPGGGGGNVCDKKTRALMLVGGEYMMIAGLLVGQCIPLLELAGNEGVAVVALSLYLVHVHIQALMSQFAVDNRATYEPRTGFNDMNIAQTEAFIRALREFSASQDSPAICRKAVQTALAYNQQVQNGSLPNLVAKEAFMTNQYNVGPNNYTQRKLRAEVLIYVNNPPQAADNLDNGAGDILLQSGAGTRIFSQLFETLANRALSQNQVFRVIHHALYSLDRQPHVAARRGTNTNAPIGGYDSDDDGGIMHIAGDISSSTAISDILATGEGTEPGVTNTQTQVHNQAVEAENNDIDPSQQQDQDSSTLTLGSILLDSSEKQLQQQQHVAGSADGDSELLHQQQQQDLESPSETTKGGKQTGTSAASSKSGKSSFKRVTARLL